jgi:hypothetical protein
MTEPASKADIQSLKGLIAELTVRTDSENHAIVAELKEIRVQLADIQALLEAQIPQGEPEEEES